MMKFTLSWLKQFLDTTESVENIASCLTALGLEVEEVIDKRSQLNGFEVAQILTTRAHPSADKLQICAVETNAGVLQIICGARNARANIKVVLAKIGCEIPKGKFTIKETLIRGEKSCGMLCSEEELLLSTNSEGIIELPDSAKIGDSLIEYYGLDDPVFHINVTPNRGDALGVYGIARDLAAKGLGQLKEPVLPTLQENFQSNITLKIQDQTMVKLFCIREIRNLQNRESPEWLKILLKNIGVKSVSRVVDVTNYILYSFGQPLHVYDKNKFTGELQVALLTQKSKFMALNGKEYDLEPGDLVVEESEQIQSLAGIIGSNYSSCTLETQHIILEAACFTPQYITKTGRRLQIDTESRYRFERNIDQSFTMKALNIAAEMITSICEGEVSEIVYHGEINGEKKFIEFPIGCLAKITGMHLTLPEICNILESLGFSILPEEQEAQQKSHDTLKLLIPSWRHDINIKEDIIEEIIRIYGYERLKAIPLPQVEVSKTNGLMPEQKRVGEVRRILASCGYDEVVTNSFMCGQAAKLFTPIQEDLFLLNPLTIDNNYMRPSIIPNLLKIVKKNLDRSIKDMALMEVGPIFNSSAIDGELLFVAGIRCGHYNVKNYHSEARLFDVFDIKSDLEIALTNCGLFIDKCLLATVDLPYYHPTKSSLVKLGREVIAYFGQIHPTILKYFDIKEEVFAFEINISNLPIIKIKNEKKGSRKGEFKVSDFQTTFRDYAFVVASDQPVGEIINSIKTVDKHLIKSVELFDIYSKLPGGKKSVAIKVQFQADDRTLNETELNRLSEMIVGNIHQKFQGYLRE